MPKKIISLDELSRFKDNLDLVLDNKANVDGNYPTMRVGLADDLYYKGGQGSLQTKPFIFQATGTDSNTSTVQIGNFASFRSLRGNSVVENQLFVPRASGTPYGVTVTNNGDGSLTFSGTATSNGYPTINDWNLYQITFIANHKYLVVGGSSTLPFYIGGGSAITDNSIVTYSTNRTNISTLVTNGTTYNITIKPQVIDLTLMFGAGNEPTSVLEFIRLFPKPYYDYNIGTLLSCKVNGIKVVGYNAWDEEWELGRINTDKTSSDFGRNLTSGIQIRCKNYIPVIKGQTYTLEMPSGYNLFYFEYDKDYNPIFFNSNGYDYWSTPHAITLDNNCCYLRFYMAPSYGTIYNNDICIHLTWDGSRTGYEPYESKTYALPNVELRSNPNTGTYDEIKPDGTYIQRVDIRAYQSDDENDNSVFTDKTNTIYDLQTPIETQNDNYKYQQIQPIDDFGTQEFLYDSNIDIPIPQGYEAYYPANYAALVDQLYRHTDGDAYKLVLETELNAKVLNFMTAISGYDSTKTQTLKNVNGVLTWVDDE